MHDRVDGRNLIVKTVGGKDTDGWNKNIQASFKMSGSGKFAGGVKLVNGILPHIMVGVAGKLSSIQIG